MPEKTITQERLLEVLDCITANTLKLYLLNYKFMPYEYTNGMNGKYRRDAYSYSKGFLDTLYSHLINRRKGNNK